MLLPDTEKPEGVKLEELTPKMIQLLRNRCKADMYFFAKVVLGFPDLTLHVHQRVCRFLETYPDWQLDGHLGYHEQSVEGSASIMIMLPRGWFKTSLCSQAYPVWRAIRNPNIKCLLVQNTVTNACAKFGFLDDTFKKNKLFQTLFPELIPGSNQTWRTDAKCVPRTKSATESTFEAAGTRTNVVSRHYDLIIEDDTVAPGLDDMGSEVCIPSKEEIDKAIGFHKLIPGIKINHEKTQNLVVGTRWYVSDLLNYIMENESDLFRFHKRAIREDVNGNPDPSGPIMYPERFNDKVCKILESQLGPYMYRCLYLNSPVLPDQMSFKPEWFQTYVEAPQFMEIHTSVDPAGDPEDSKGSPDYTVVMTTGKDTISGRIYVLHYWRQRCNPGEMINEIFRQVKAYGSLSCVVESVAYQNTIRYWIKEKMVAEGYFFICKQVPSTHTRKSKNAKIMGLQPLFANKMIFMKEWMKDLRTELQSFPLGAHDDVADALCMQIHLWAATQMRKKAGPSPHDPMSFDAAIEELVGRHTNKPSVVLDSLSGHRNRIKQYL